MDKITVEIKEELEFETIIDEHLLDEIAQFFIDMIIIPYIEDEYIGCGGTNIIGEALIEKLSNTSYDDINIGMAKAILKYFEKNKIRG